MAKVFLTNFFKKLLTLADGFFWALLVVVFFGLVFPVKNFIHLKVLKEFVFIAISLLFFLHGIKVPWKNFVLAFANWKLQIAILFSTFVFFPLLAIVFKLLFIYLAGNSLYLGILFLCAMPSTVQSSVSFTSIAGGNVSAAIWAASVSSILGIFISPLIVSFMLSSSAGVEVSLNSFWLIIKQIFFPFLAGQLLRKFLIDFINNHKVIITLVDRGSILLMVFMAFSEASAYNSWGKINALDLVLLVVLSLIILLLAFSFTYFIGRYLGLNRADRLTVLFCGSKKSLATGIPMASIIFPKIAPVIIIPLMIFHQLQLMVSSFIALKAKNNKNFMNDNIL